MFMLNTFMNILLPVEGTAAVLLAARLLFGYDFKRKKTLGIAAAVLLFVFNTAASFLVGNAEDAMLVSEIVLVASAMIVPTLILEHRKKMTFVWFGFIICSTFDYLESLIISFIRRPSLTQQLAVFCLIYLAALIIIIAVQRIFKPSVPSEFLENLPPLLYVVLFVADYSAYYDVMVSRDAEYYVEFLNILKLVSASLITGSFAYVIYKYASVSFKEKETQLRLESELRHYEEMMLKNRDIRTFRHDYKNNLYSINAFIKSGRTDEAEEYINNLYDELTLTDNKFSTGNYLADALFSDKALGAEKQGIDIVFSGTIPKEGISNNDLCTVLSNAVDNAITASIPSAPCKIEITAQEKPSGFVIKIKNPVKEKVVIKNNSIASSKSDKQNHGFGISNIKRAVKKYNGYTELYCDDEFFTIEIGMIFDR